MALMLSTLLRWAAWDIALKSEISSPVTANNHEGLNGEQRGHSGEGKAWGSLAPIIFGSGLSPGMHINAFNTGWVCCWPWEGFLGYCSFTLSSKTIISNLTFIWKCLQIKLGTPRGPGTLEPWVYTMVSCIFVVLLKSWSEKTAPLYRLFKSL